MRLTADGAHPRHREKELLGEVSSLDILDDEDDDEEEEEELEEEDMEEEDDDSSSVGSVPDENIDFGLVYAMHTFVATVEGQASVVRGDALALLDDSNSYWWLVKVLKTEEVGYIPAENIETPFERLARLNKHKNTELQQASNLGVVNPSPTPKTDKPKKKVTMAPIVSYQLQIVTHLDGEEYDEEEYQEWQENLPSDTDSDYNDGEVPDREGRRSHSKSAARSSITRLQKPFTSSGKKSPTSTEPPKEKSGLKKFFSRNKDKKTEKQDKNKKPPVETTQAERDDADTVSLTQMDSNTSSELTLEDNVEFEMHSETRAEKRSTNSLVLLKVYAGTSELGSPFKTVLVNAQTISEDLVEQALSRFRSESTNENDKAKMEGVYYCTVKHVDGEQYTLSPQDKPLSIFQTLTASLNTPMPSTKHIKRISQLLSTVEKYTNGNSGSLSEVKAPNRHITEDSVIKFFLHRQQHHASDDDRRLVIRMSISMKDVVDQADDLETAVDPRASVSARYMQNRPRSPYSRENEDRKIDVTFTVASQATNLEVTRIALRRFKLFRGVAVGDSDVQQRLLDVDPQGPIYTYALSVVHSGHEYPLQPQDGVLTAFQGNPIYADMHRASIISSDAVVSDMDDARRLSRDSEDGLTETRFWLRLVDASDATKSINAVSDGQVLHPPRHRMPMRKATAGVIGADDSDFPDDRMGGHIEDGHDEREEHAAKLEARLKAFDTPIARAQMRDEPQSNAFDISGRIQLENNEKDGVDIILPGQQGTLRSSRNLDDTIRYSFVGPSGKETEISNLVEDILGGMSPDIAQQLRFHSDYDSISADDDQESIASESSEPIFEQVHRPQHQGQSTSKSDLLAAYIEEASSQSRMQPNTVDRLEKVLKSVPRYKSSPTNQSETTPKETKPPTSPAMVDDIDVGRAGSSVHTTPALSSSASLSPTSPHVSPRALRSPGTPAEAENAKTSPKLAHSPPVAAKRMPEPVINPQNGSARDSWYFTDDFGLEDLMTIVRAKAGVYDNKALRRTAANDLEERSMSPKFSVHKDVEVRQDIKEVFRDSLSALDDVEKDLDRLVSEAVSIF